jgi:hypothetical protein
LNVVPELAVSSPFLDVAEFKKLPRWSDQTELCVFQQQQQCLIRLTSMLDRDDLSDKAAKTIFSSNKISNRICTPTVVTYSKLGRPSIDLESVANLSVHFVWTYATHMRVYQPHAIYTRSINRCSLEG